MEIYQTGWVCPKCGRVFSPTTVMCSFCVGPFKTNLRDTSKDTSKDTTLTGDPLPPNPVITCNSKDKTIKNLVDGLIS